MTTNEVNFNLNKGGKKMTTIIDILVQTGNFKILSQFLQVTDLSDTLKNPGPFTIFAPNDVAFAKLSKETILELIKDAPKLMNVLLYHVIPGKLMVAELIKLNTAKTLQGQTVFFEFTPMRKVPRINDQDIVKTDLIADNGIVHIIEKVLMPQ
jgi:uncharacterized surface protein with fasciclin (FAS1) repeats